ncbi:MAG TPA: hypothetical protein VIH99_12020, partial [Bdellovibrionota bacterium]
VCEMQKVAFAALMLGVFSLSPTAKAEEQAISLERQPAVSTSEKKQDRLDAGSNVVKSATETVSDEVIAEEDNIDPNAPDAIQDGMHMSDMAKIGQGFKISLNGNKLVFSGRILKRCANGITVDVQTRELADKVEHGLKINVPDCTNFQARKSDRLNSNFTTVNYAFPKDLIINSSLSGNVCLLVAANINDPLECEALTGSDGKALNYVSQTAIDAAAKVEVAKKEKADADKKADALVAKLDMLCQKGDMVGFGKELEAAQSVLGNIIQYLDMADDAFMKKYIRDIKTAKDADAAAEAYDNFLSASSERGWDTEEVEKAYVERRVSLLDEVLKDEIPAGKKAAAIREFASALRDLDNYREHKPRIAVAYSQLAHDLAVAGDYDGAEANAERAMEFASAEQRLQLEQELAKMFNEAAEQCLAENKLSPGKCDRLAQKAKKHVNGAMAAQKGIGGDGSLEALAAMKSEKIQMFGVDGYTTNVSGYGAYNMTGGEYDVKKMQAFQQGQQERYMQMIMQRNMGGYSNGMPGAGAGSGAGTSAFFH